MSTLVLLEGQVQPEKIGEMKQSLAEVFPSTRSYEGSQGIDGYFNMDDQGNMVILEKWGSRSQHEKYLQWRTETGVMDKLGSMLVGPPSIKYFDRVEA